VHSRPHTGGESSGGTAGAANGGPTVQLVERKTELRCLHIGRRRPKKGRVRKDTEEDLRGLSPEVPYVKAEQALKDLVCSLMERQDRMNEEILGQVISLQYWVDELETWRESQ
jgi:hypothetical protein